MGTGETWRQNETTLEKLADKKRKDRPRLEREGDDIMELSRKYERKEEEERQEKHNVEMWAKWEDRQRLERQGDEIMEQDDFGHGGEACSRDVRT